MSKHPAQPAAALKPPDSFMARLTRSRWMLALAATLIALPAVWLLIVRGLPTIADDTPVHLMRLFVFDQQVRQGEWLPRWIPDLYIGYGYPLFNFYAPAMYYVAETLHLGGLGQATAYGWSYVLAVVIGAVGAAFLGSDLYATSAGAGGQRERSPLAPRPSPLPSFWPGLLAAAAYTYATYLLANVFVRGAFGEIGAQALLPWLFWSLRRMMLAPRRDVASLAPSVVLGAVLLALLAMTHTISLLLALPCLATYAIVLAMAQRAQGATRWHTLAAPAAAAVLAALLSAVIWLPQLLERGSLSESAWSTQLLLDNLWRWRDFVDLDLRFRAIDGGQTPYQLSAIQMFLLLLGLLFTRRRSAEWWLWVAILAVCGLLVSPLSAPLWANLNALAIVQFPWRLLSLMGLAVALIGAGVATAFPTGTARAIGASLLVALIVITQAPRPGETPFLTAPDDITLSLAAVNRFEQAEPAYGAGYDDEFLPKWANVDALTNPAPALSPIDASVRVEETWHTGGLRATAEAASPIPLMSSQFYFPGWQARVDTGAPSPAAPDAATGLVRSDLPAGDNALEIARATTTAGQAGGVLAGVGLVLLLVALLLTARRAFVALAAAALMVGFVWLNGARPTPPLAVDATVDLPMPAAPGLDLADIDSAVTATGQLAIRPIWFVRAGQPDLLTHWRLTDSTGGTVSELRGAPRFGTWSPSTWRPGALMQDAAELGLPPGLPAGEYILHLALVDAATSATVLPMQAVLRLDLPAQAALEPTHDVGVNFGMADGVPVATLGALRVAVDGTRLDPATTVAPGATVGVDLLWQQLTPDVYPYQSLVEIVDHAQRKIAALDLQVGWRGDALDLWHGYLVPHERATLRLPDDLPSGLYTLRVAARDRRSDERLPVTDQAGNALGDNLAVATFKVLANGRQRPATSLKATFGDAIELTGFTLADPAAVQPGETLTVTLFYRARGTPAIDYTRFLQLHSPALGMAAQADAQPQDGANPTSTWRAGELIAETVTLPVAADAAPGAYRLLLGYYDAANGGTRLPATDRRGAAFPDNAVPLLELTVAPASSR